jgi:hypothetical protein
MKISGNILHSTFMIVHKMTNLTGVKSLKKRKEEEEEKSRNVYCQKAQ